MKKKKKKKKKGINSNIQCFLVWTKSVQGTDKTQIKVNLPLCTEHKICITYYMCVTKETIKKDFIAYLVIVQLRQAFSQGWVASSVSP